MSSPVISVEHLSKAYRIGVKEEIPDTLMGAMKNVITAPWKNFKALRRLNTSTDSPIPIPQSPVPNPPDSDTLWALRDVSFEINQGDVVGIIGRNGAGKSTLLKVLSRITEPTSGRVVIRGRVSSLLEVGTGFHPELTGRENVYMNGTILGMRKKEIDRKFNEIVEFSGVEKFLDTPTKRYSSGMQVRLAFAVAAHLEPEILIIDEVLAVGDAEFQEKCLGKMQSIASCGRTVLFVSHNLSLVRQLCNSAIVLSQGTIREIGGLESCLALNNDTSTNTVWENNQLSEKSKHGGIVVEALLLDSQNMPCAEFGCGEEIRVMVKFRWPSKSRKPHCILQFNDQYGSLLFSVSTILTEDTTHPTGGNCLVCAVPCIPLAPGQFSIGLRFGTLENDLNEESHSNILGFRMLANNFYGGGKMPHPKRGAFVVRSKWQRYEIPGELKQFNNHIETKA